MAAMFGLAGCGSEQAATISFSEPAEFADSKLESYRLRVIDAGDELVVALSSETQGWVLTGIDGSVKYRHGTGDSKSLDVVSGDGIAWVGFVDERGNYMSLAEYNYDKQVVTPLQWQGRWPGALASVCLGPAFDPIDVDETDYIQAWTITEEGIGYQTFIEIQNRQVVTKGQRSVGLGEGVASCSIGSDGRLYWSQEGVGLLSMNADAELDEERRLHIPVSKEFSAPTDMQWLNPGELLLTYDGKAGILFPDDDNLFVSIDGKFPEDTSSIGSLISSTTEVKAGAADWIAVTDEGSALWLAKVRGLQPIENTTHVSHAAKVMADAETRPVESYGDAADDPEIWVNPLKPEASLVLATDKRQGLWVYDLKGEVVQFLDRGRVNNVDLRQGVKLSDGTYLDVAVATNRSTNNVDVFWINGAGEVHFVTSNGIGDSLGVPYGACLGYDSGILSVFVNNKAGKYEQWALLPQRSANQLITVTSRKLSEFRLDGQPEGCVHDDRSGTLYMGQEDFGIWKMSPSKGGASLQLVDDTSTGNLVADVEGMSLYHGRNGAPTYLVVSSQGDNSYVLYDISDDRFVGRFQVAANVAADIDGTSETDGLAVTSQPLGELFPRGMLVVQDGRNRMPRERQNFKYVSWSSIESVLILSN